MHHLASHFFDLQVTHAAELVPAGAEQGRYLPPPGDGFGRIAPVSQSVLVAFGCATAFSAAVHPALPSVPAAGISDGSALSTVMIAEATAAQSDIGPKHGHPGVQTDPLPLGHLAFGA